MSRPSRSGRWIEGGGAPHVRARVGFSTRTRTRTQAESRYNRVGFIWATRPDTPHTQHAPGSVSGASRGTSLPVKPLKNVTLGNRPAR